jgi:CBS domain-containing protein
MGFISSDGLEESLDADTEEYTDINGEVICVLTSKETEKITITLASTTDDALKEMHGHDNVTTADGMTTITHKSGAFSERVYVFELLTKNNKKWRKVLPNARVSSRGPIVHGAGNVYAREIEYTLSPDANGVRMYDYIERAAS